MGEASMEENRVKAKGDRHLRLVSNGGTSVVTPLDTLLCHYFGPEFKTMLKDPAAAFPSEDDEIRLRNVTTLQALNHGTTAGEPAGEEEVNDVEG